MQYAKATYCNVNCIIIMPPRLTYTAQTARTYFMRLSKAVEADYILTENTNYTDLPKGGAIAIVKKC